MNIESQVTSFELSKKLKELGVNQESLFCWISDFDLEYLPTELRNHLVCIPAYTVAELGRMLPDLIHATSASGNDRPIIMNKVGDQYQVAIMNSNQTRIPIFHDTNEANARAMMLVFLIATGFNTNAN